MVNKMMTSGMYSSKDPTWATPPEVYEPLNAEFNFTLDVCANPNNAKHINFFTPEDDGLAQSWKGHRCWMNPPYGREIAKWVKKAHDEHKKHGITVVCLLPARTDTAYFHDYIYHKAEIRFLRGRVKFINADGRPLNSAPFPSMIVIYR